MKNLIIAMIAVAAVVYFLFTAFFADIQINKYETIQAVQDQKAIQKGWIPALLPVSAYDIAETHDIDKNELFGSFRYKEEDEAGLMQNLTPLHDEKNTYMWENFLFRVDTKTNHVKFRNNPAR